MVCASAEILNESHATVALLSQRSNRTAGADPLFFDQHTSVELSVLDRTGEQVNPDSAWRFLDMYLWDVSYL